MRSSDQESRVAGLCNCFPSNHGAKRPVQACAEDDGVDVDSGGDSNVSLKQTQ